MSTLHGACSTRALKTDEIYRRAVSFSQVGDTNLPPLSSPD